MGSSDSLVVRPQKGRAKADCRTSASFIAHDSSCRRPSARCMVSALSAVECAFRAWGGGTQPPTECPRTSTPVANATPAVSGGRGRCRAGRLALAQTASARLGSRVRFSSSNKERLVEPACCAGCAKAGWVCPSLNFADRSHCRSFIDPTGESNGAPTVVADEMPFGRPVGKRGVGTGEHCGAAGGVGVAGRTSARFAVVPQATSHASEVVETCSSTSRVPAAERVRCHPGSRSPSIEMPSL